MDQAADTIYEDAQDPANKKNNRYEIKKTAHDESF